MLPVLIFWDTETTGVGKSDEIIEISMLRVPIECAQDTHFEQLTLRLRPVHNTCFPRASAVHGLTYDTHLRHCATFIQAAPAILSFIGQTSARPTILVAHNSSFDQRMLLGELHRAELLLPPGISFACSLKMLRAAKKAGELDVDKCSLGVVYEHLLQKPLTGAHGALSDSLGVLHVMQHLKQHPVDFHGCPFERLVDGAVQACGLAGAMAEVSILEPALEEAIEEENLGEGAVTQELLGLEISPPMPEVSTNTTLCTCGKQTVRFLVKKATSPNTGRAFWCCPMPRHSQCGFFEWDVDTVPDLKHPNSAPKCACKDLAVLRTVQKHGPNKGREFYSCPKAVGAQCGFFEWNTDVVELVKDSEWKEALCEFAGREEGSGLSLIHI